MIAIRRSECPQILMGQRKKRTAHNDPHVVRALWEMQYQKCCYCEKLIPQGGAEANVEHFRPKSSHKRLMNSWSNLLLACGSCNNKKRDKFPVARNGDPLLIDPTDANTDPEDHLTFIISHEHPMYGSIMERNASLRGRTTIDTVGLANSFLIRNRKTTIREVMGLYMEILETTDETSRSQAVQRLEQRLGANCEHAAVAREFARANGLEAKLMLTIPRGAELGG